MVPQERCYGIFSLTTPLWNRVKPSFSVRLLPPGPPGIIMFQPLASMPSIPASLGHSYFRQLCRLVS